MYVTMYACMHLCMYVWVGVRAYVCMYIHTYLYILMFRTYGGGGGTVVSVYSFCIFMFCFSMIFCNKIFLYIRDVMSPG